MQRIYVDNAATTRVSKPILKLAGDVMESMFYNPSSIYREAHEAKAKIEESRMILADILGAKSEEIFFTSGGTESDNWAIKGLAIQHEGGHIITSMVEHHAVLHVCQELEKKGYSVTYLPVDEMGMIDLQDLEKAIREDTFLITIMFANNEIGTIQPIEEIGRLARKNNIVFHTDAVQAFGKIRIDVNKLSIDMLSLSAHKIHGLKGSGALFIRKGIRIQPLLHGGGQEKKKRSGTENIVGIVTMGETAKLSYQDLEEKNNTIMMMRDYLIDEVLKTIPYARLNGDATRRLAGNVNFSFEFIEGESLLMLLEKEGILASSGSACTSGSLDPSHVLLAIGLPHEKAHGSLRISLDYEENTLEQMDHLIRVLPGIVEKLRDLSPLYEDFINGGA